MRPTVSSLSPSLLGAALLGVLALSPALAAERVQTRETGLFAAGRGQHVQFNLSNHGSAPVLYVPCVKVCAPVVVDDRVGGIDGVHRIACGPATRLIELPAVQGEPNADVVWVFDLDTLDVPRDARGRAHIGLELHVVDPPDPDRNLRARFDEVLHTIEVFDGATGETSNYFGSSALVTRGGD
jgi:hypothetical protein